MEKPKIENEIRLCEVKWENVRTTMEKLKCVGSDVLFFTLQWKDLEDYQNSLQKNLSERLREIMSKEMDLQSRSLAVEERGKKVEAVEALVNDLEIKANGFRDEIEEKKKELDVLKNQGEFFLGESKEVEMRLTQLRKSVEECTVEERLKTNQLNESLRKIQVEVDLKGEELKKMDSDLEWYNVEVSTKEEHLCRTQTCSRELEEEIDRKTKDLSSVRDQIAECEKLFEKQSVELAKTQGEVELKGKQLEQMNIDLERHRREVIVEMEELDKSQTRSRELEEEIERKGIALTEVLDKTAECRKLLDERSSELVCKEKKLEELRLDVDLLDHSVKTLNGEMEETCKQIESKVKKLEDIERLIEEGNTRYESIKKLIKEHSEELASKEKKQNEISEAIRKLSLQIASEEKTLERAKAFTERASKKHHEKEKSLDSTRRNLEKCKEKYDMKKNELRSVKDSLGECLHDLDVKEKELKSLESLFTEINKQVEEGEKRMQHLNNSNEELSRKIEVKQEELCSINKTIKECSSESEVKRNDLDQVQTSVTNLIAELKSKECELDSVKNKIQDFQSKKEQQERLEASLINREKEFGLMQKELDAREEKIDKRDQELKSLEQKLAKCTKEIEQQAKRLSSFRQQGNTDQQVVSVREQQPPDSRSEAVHENIASSSSSIANEDTLKELDGSSSFSPNEVLTGLQYKKDPGSYVLNFFNDALMDARQRGELSLGEPIVKTLVPLFEELPRVVRPSEHLKAEARKLAQQWSLMMGNTCQMSPLEVWGFLQLIVAYELVDSTKQNQTLEFASNVAHFRQAPKLFQSLGLSFAIPNFVKQLRNERKVIEAMRFMFYFNLNPPPLELLKEEIINLRQVEERDGGRKLRDIIELIEDFNLEIDLPVDLILKFMVPREAQASPTVIPSSYINNTHGFNLSVSTIFGESSVVQAQSSHQSGQKRPRIDPRVPSSSIRPCFNASSSHGR